MRLLNRSGVLLQPYAATCEKTNILSHCLPANPSRFVASTKETALVTLKWLWWGPSGVSNPLCVTVLAARPEHYINRHVNGLHESRMHKKAALSSIFRIIFQ